ncbi:bifunctional metallophosphatase/5'-nucleotidase [Streptacidiphilus sp. ASG 303]|uniref:bifunctional metallophosphatase/5'-nucleotidase n=1 Tax=Streptacidiphilus sp. ASG 303 TaxID=2896847 RepID=UPI001E552A1B|nr:bifunctional metallophosphatase/5'-nucleotidase [Streptacidiphilus sp. ASG 303]MCD0485599.1 bifunctional metallophosphatase/5'-nucleotidase [Streptacidiphilus sp. ASG 303]
MPETIRTGARRSRLLLTAAASAGLVALAIPAATASAADAQPAPAGLAAQRIDDLQLLAINDFHGNLEPPAGSSGTIKEKDASGAVVSTPAGGVEYLATALRQAREGHKHSLTVAAGDIVGASPLLSGLFHDEPTVEAMNKIGLDVTSVGNHEFDEGSAELLRLQNGGCHPTDGCYAEGRKFKGAKFDYLAANVTSEATGKPLLAPYWVKNVHGVKVGFIGVTLEGTPNIVTAAGVKGLKFGDEVETINRYTAELKQQGVRTIVALVHEGGYPAGNTYDADCDSPGAGAGISGPIVDIAKNVDPEVDAIVTGHTHNAYNCTIPDPAGQPRRVTSAASFGRLYTEIDLPIDHATGDVVRSSVTAANHVVRRTVPKAADLTDLIAYYQRIAAPIAGRTVGYISADINGRGSDAYEKPLGDVIADAQLEGLAPADKGGAQIALMNPGGIRADLVQKASGTEGDGVVTYAEAFAVQPFTNMMNVVDLTGAQVVAALQQQVSGSNLAAPKILQVSRGLTYTLDLTKAGADRVVASSIRLNGEPIDPARTYRVAMNEFLAGGGDGFPALAQGTNKLVGPSDLDLFTAYLTAHSSAASPLAPPAQDRITVVGPGTAQG